MPEESHAILHTVKKSFHLWLERGQSEGELGTHGGHISERLLSPDTELTY